MAKDASEQNSRHIHKYFKESLDKKWKNKFTTEVILENAPLGLSVSVNLFNCAHTKLFKHEKMNISIQLVMFMIVFPTIPVFLSKQTRNTWVKLSRS